MYATTFNDLSIKKRAGLLCNFLKLKPENSDDSFKGYKQVLSFMVGGMLILSKPRYASDTVILGTEKKRINEHTIPISIVVNYLLTLEKSKITNEYISKVLNKLCGIALLSKSEDELLNKNLKTTLPPGIRIEDIIEGSVSHSCRYDYVGISYKELNKNKDLN